jgi:hypothetical protein
MTGYARNPQSIPTFVWIMTQAFKNVTISDYKFQARAFSATVMTIGGSTHERRRIAQH